MAKPDSEAVREVRYEHSADFVPLLSQLGTTLLVTTFQAGKLVAISADQGKLSLSFVNFEQCMGVAARRDQLAVGTKQQVWYLVGAPDIAFRLPPEGRHDACFLTRRSHFTGEIDGHEMAWAGDELWLVNTLFSCLCTLDERHSFVPRWKPNFVTALAAEDRCHLNGLGLENGRPKYVTALAETDTPQGWRPDKATTGCVIDVESNDVIARGLAMAHSPRVHLDRLWVLDSGRGTLLTIDRTTGQRTIVAEVPGYTRGLACIGPFAFVGLSKIRETSTFGGLPLAERRQDLKCGIAVVDLRSGQTVATLQFVTGVDEIFDVQLLPETRLPHISGPHATTDGQPAIWSVPIPGSAL